MEEKEKRALLKTILENQGDLNETYIDSILNDFDAGNELDRHVHPTLTLIYYAVVNAEDESDVYNELQDSIDKLKSARSRC